MRMLDKARLLRSLFAVRMSTSSSKPNFVSTWISSLKRTFHPVCRRGGPLAAQRMIGGIAQYKEECRYAPRKLCRGSCTRRTLHDSIFSEESRVHRSCRRHAGAWDRSNTAIFTIVHGVPAAPRLSKPDQLMYLTAESPAIGGTRNALSAPEYTEFRQMNQSFAAVGAYSTGGAAYTTGEVNLTAGDRPLRVRSISVDAHLLKAPVFSRSRDGSSATKKPRVGPGRYRHRSRFPRTNCGEQRLEDDRSLDKRWKSRAAPTKSLALCRRGRRHG